MDRRKKEMLKVLNFSIDGIFIEDTCGNILLCNQAGAEMFGYTIEEMQRLNISNLVPPQEGYYLKDEYKEEDLFPNEYIKRINIKKDGTLIKTEINSKIVSENGQKYLVAFVRNAQKPAGTDPNAPKKHESEELLDTVCKGKIQANLILHNSVGKEKYVVPLQMVEYLESWLKTVNTHLINGIILKSYDTLNALENRIAKESNFLRCHQSYLVNLRYVELDEKQSVFITSSGMLIPIRRRKYSQIKQKYYCYKILFIQE